MKDKLLQVRMSEKELEDLKKFTEQIGFKNTSETVRESLKAFTVIKEREPEGNDYAKYCDSHALLYSIKHISKEVDMDKYVENPLKFFLRGVDEEVKLKNIELYDSGIYETLKETALRSVYNDLLYNRELSDKMKSLIKDIAIESLRK